MEMSEKKWKWVTKILPKKLTPYLTIFLFVSTPPYLGFWHFGTKLPIMLQQQQTTPKPCACDDAHKSQVYKQLSLLYSDQVIPISKQDSGLTKRQKNKIKLLQKKRQYQNKYQNKFVFHDNQQRHDFQYVSGCVNPFTDFYNKFTFDNQRNFAIDIASKYSTDLKVLNTLAIAPTQSGKTGSMLALMFQFMNTPNIALPKEHIFVITAHSSKEWLEQTRERFPDFMHDQIFHRNTLSKFVQTVKDLKNVLIIVDECHIAAKFGQAIHKLYDSLNLFDINHMYNDNIKIVNFTATPECLQEQLETHWKQSAYVATMDVPDSYISYHNLSQQGRVFQMKDLSGYSYNTKTVENISQIHDNISEIRTYLGDIPKYHIIRTPRGQAHKVVMDNFKRVFADICDAVYISEPSLSKNKKNMDSLLAVSPNSHTFIFIKDKLRCAKTLHKQHIGVLYERFVNKPSSSTILQGLYGRLTGFHQNTNSVVFSQLINQFKFKYSSFFVPF